MENKKHPCNFDENFVNVAAYLTWRSKISPYKMAVAFPESRDKKKRVAWTHLTFLQLEELSNKYSNGLKESGIRRGDRTLLMVRPSLDFIALAFSLFKIGSVPVLIDPGMGVGNLLECIKTVKPRAMVAISEVMLLKGIFKSYFSSIEISIVAGKSRIAKNYSTDYFLEKSSSKFEIEKTGPDDVAAILFTTGSTGPAKGVVYEHSMFEAQVRHLIDNYKIGEDEVEMPAFPLFALFSPALGVTCVIPEMDPTKPAEVDPEKIIEAINSFGVTNTFGSPAIWKRVGDYCIKNKIKLPTLKRILMAGAPVPLEVLGKFTQILSKNGDVHTPYGATESLPTFNVTGSEILKPERIRHNQNGGGTLVGKPLPGMMAEVIKIIDEPIETWDDSLTLGKNEIGEIVVTGPTTTKTYFNRERDTKLAKIKDGNRIWHRMGDLGYVDDEGYFWFCGRKGHRVETEEGLLTTIKCEAIFNNHKKVYRSALVGLGEYPNQIPVIIIEPYREFYPRNKDEEKEFIDELLELGQNNEYTKKIKIVKFYPEFPTDIRHNAKIFREKLKIWAETGKMEDNRNLAVKIGDLAKGLMKK